MGQPAILGGFGEQHGSLLHPDGQNTSHAPGSGGVSGNAGTGPTCHLSISIQCNGYLNIREVSWEQQEEIA